MHNNLLENDVSIQNEQGQAQHNQNQGEEEKEDSIADLQVINQQIIELEQNQEQQLIQQHEIEELPWFLQDDNALVTCPFCEDQMLKKYYQDHLDLCEQQIGNFNLIEQECKQCNEKIVKLYYYAHLDVCQANFYIEVKCPYCSDPIIKAFLNEHISQCKIYLEEKKKEKQGIKNCAICLEDIQEDKTTLNCCHTFHEGCIENWLQTKQRCPICKRFANRIQ